MSSIFNLLILFPHFYMDASVLPYNGFIYMLNPLFSLVKKKNQMLNLWLLQLLFLNALFKNVFLIVIITKKEIQIF